MQYEKIELNYLKRSRRTKVVNLSDFGNHVVFDLKSSPYGSDSNYFALLVGDGSTIEFALGGAYIDVDSNDTLPDDYDFHLIGASGHYEAQGRMFNTNLRLWVRGVGSVTLIY